MGNAMKTKDLVMTPNHPLWASFVEKLDGPDACNFRKEKGEITWNCKHKHDHSRRILSEMLMDVDESIEYFIANGGYCDCEVLFNVNQEGY